MTSKTAALSILPLAWALSACAHAAGTQPHEMSVAEHEQAAIQEDTQAAQHAAQVDPSAKETQERCTPGKGRVCWTVTSNPTAGHQDQAAQHSELAAQHRAASTALADAETRACVGLSEEDRDTSPFAHRDDISRVAQLKEEKVVGKSRATSETGATIVFRATPGLTAEWLQRIVDCHLARNAAVGHDVPEMAYCPLVPRGAEANVHSTGNGFAVDVRAKDAAAAAEIWRRAQLLTTSR